jgi:ankyrin repeat protein
MVNKSIKKKENDNGKNQKLLTKEMSIFKYSLKSEFMGFSFLIMNDIETIQSISDSLQTEKFRITLSLISKNNKNNLQKKNKEKKNLIHIISEYNSKNNQNYEETNYKLNNGSQNNNRNKNNYNRNKKNENNEKVYDKWAIEFIKELFSKFEKNTILQMINEKDDIGNTPLFYSVMNNYYSLTKYLLENGSKINIYNELNESVLFVSCKNNNYDITNLLLKYVKDNKIVDLQNKEGNYTY